MVDISPFAHVPYFSREVTYIDRTWYLIRPRKLIGDIPFVGDLDKRRVQLDVR
jgi:hypothetical protein